MPSLNVLITINAATLIAIVTIGVKLIRIFDKIEFKTELMWKDYERRVQARNGKDEFNRD